MIRIERYNVIVDVLCRYYGVNESEMIVMFKRKDIKYLYLLLLSKYDCLYKEKLIDGIIFRNNSSIKYNLKKAEEKLLINKEFRDNYVFLDNTIKKES